MKNWKQGGISMKVSIFVAGMLSSILLSGCTAFQPVKAAVRENGAQVADETLNAAVWLVCSGATTGAIQRRFKTDEERSARDTVCGTQ